MAKYTVVVYGATTLAHLLMACVRLDTVKQIGDACSGRPLGLSHPIWLLTISMTNLLHLERNRLDSTRVLYR